MKGRIEINRELCKGCGLCVSVCAKKQIEISSRLNTKGYYPALFKEENLNGGENSKCTGCALCALTCPDVAIEVYREAKDTSKPDENSEEG